MEDRWAEADGDNRVISVNNTLRGDRLKFYLLHEYLHAILHVSGHTARFKTSEEEALVSALTHGLAPLIELDTSVKT
jgi:Zn-dependent peptidase ImmA (M78 family)